MTAGDNIYMWGEGKRRNREEESSEKISAGVIEKSCSAVSGVLDVRYTDIFFFFSTRPISARQSGGYLEWRESNNLHLFPLVPRLMKNAFTTCFALTGFSGRF